jgi:hypothetical protein
MRVIHCEILVTFPTETCRLTSRFLSPLVMKVRSRPGSVRSGASTPGGGMSRTLSEGDLEKADAALSKVNGTAVNGTAR